MAESIELAKAYLQIVPTTKNFKNNLERSIGNDAESGGQEAGRKAGNGFMSGMNAVLGTMAKALSATVAAGGAAIGKALFSSVSEYANYEQLVGGVETLFEDLDSFILENASNAYKTAGLSANQYLETVMSFGAALNASLKEANGNIMDADKIADQAIRDMADNANKMGSSMESIQNAYQGFAKQNYTMLDNLKLGYGGTKTEMERLIKDANKLKEAQGEVGDLTIESYADIIEAIHLVQDEMGITGTTQLEAGTTIIGSLSSVKAAWQNFLTGAMDPNQDLSGLINNLLDSLFGDGSEENKGFLGNIVPRLIEGVPRFVEGLTQLFNEVIPYMPELINALLPGLIEGAGALAAGLIQALPDILAIIIEELPGLLGQLWDALGGALGGLKDKLTEYFPELGGVFDGIETSANGAVEFLTGAFKGDWDQAWEGLKTSVTGLQETIAAIDDTVTDALTETKKKMEEEKPDWTTVFGEFGKTINDFQDSGILAANGLIDTFQGVLHFFTGVFTLDFEKAWDGIKEFLIGIMEMIGGIVEWLVNAVILFINKVLIGGLNAAADGISTVVNGGHGLFEWLGITVAIPHIPEIGFVKLSRDSDTMPQMAQGGILEKGQMGFLEGNGAEAVVPLDQNEKWIRAVAEEMQNDLEGGASLAYALEGMQVVLDTGALVGGISGTVDRSLGMNGVIAGRGVAIA